RVLVAQPLLLPQSNGVVGLALAGLAVCAGRVRTAVEHLGAARGQGDAEPARQPGLRPGTVGHELLLWLGKATLTTGRADQAWTQEGVTPRCPRRRPRRQPRRPATWWPRRRRSA